jgi:hypothetical protein
MAAGSAARRHGPKPEGRPETPRPASHLFLKYFSVHCKIQCFRSVLEEVVRVSPAARIKTGWILAF